MLCGAHSAAKLLHRWITPALDALYAHCCCGWRTRTPAMEPRKMMEPGVLWWIMERAQAAETSWDLSEHVFSSVFRNEDVESYGKRRCLRAFA